MKLVKQKIKQNRRAQSTEEAGLTKETDCERLQKTNRWYGGYVQRNLAQEASGEKGKGGYKGKKSKSLETHQELATSLKSKYSGLITSFIGNGKNGTASQKEDLNAFISSLPNILMRLLRMPLFQRLKTRPILLLRRNSLSLSLHRSCLLAKPAYRFVKKVY